MDKGVVEPFRSVWILGKDYGHGLAIIFFWYHVGIKVSDGCGMCVYVSLKKLEFQKRVVLGYVGVIRCGDLLA